MKRHLIALQMFCTLWAVSSPLVLAQQDPDPVPSAQLLSDLTDKINRLTIPERVAILELNAFGEANHGKPLPTRVELLESCLGVDSAQTCDVVTRINNLTAAAPPPTSLIRFAATSPKLLAKKRAVPWLGTDIQRITLLELELGQKPYPQIPFLDRLRALEKFVLGINDPPPAKTIDERLDALEEQLPQQATLIPQVAKGADSSRNWFLNPAPIGWLDGLKNKTVTATSGGAQGIKRVLTAPEFWGLLLLSGAVVGTGIMLRNSSNNNSRYDVAEQTEGYCIGSMTCQYCKNCKYCKHCNAGLSPCGVHLQLYGP